MKDFITNNLKKILFVSVGIFVLIFLFCFCIFYGKYDLFKFPFNANVWGNASEWCMVIFTMLTIIFLIQTFLKQKEANELQSLLNNLEKEKHRKSQMPIFFVDDKVQTNSEGGDGNRIVTSYYFHIKLYKNEALNVDSKILNNEEIIHGFYLKPLLMVGESIIVRLRRNLQSSELGDRLELLKILFSDLEGIKYEQIVYMENSFLATTPPKLIN